MYTVLGSQASTRWSIIGQGAKSSQTQIIFRRLVNDTVVEDDQVVTMSNMTKAIVDTNVILNTAISPGFILLQSDMIILKDKIPGYNNILTIADKEMKFGKNMNVNKVLQSVDRSVDQNVEQNVDALSQVESKKDVDVSDPKIVQKILPKKVKILQKSESHLLAAFLPVSTVGGLMIAKILL